MSDGFVRMNELSLNSFWNELVRPTGAPVAGGGELETAMAETIRRVQAFGVAPPPVSSRERVRAEVRASVRQQLALRKETPVIDTAAFERTYQPPRPRAWEERERPIWLRWPKMSRRLAIAQLAAAALILAALIGGGYYWLNDRNEQPAVMTQPGTPEATPADQKSQFRYGPSHRGVSPSAGPIGQPIELWSFQTQGPIMSEPAIVDGVVYAGSGDGNLYAFEAANGAEKWRFEIGSAEGSSPAFDSGIVYVTDSAGTLFAVDASTGQEHWQFPGGRDNASLAIADGVAYIGSVDGTLYALDPETGEQIWSAPIGAEANRSAAVADGMVFVGTADGVMHAFDIATHEERWQFQREGYTPGTPVKAGDTLYFARGNGVTAVDALTGVERWGFETGTVAPTTIPVVSDDRVYVSSHDGNVYALDAATGEEQWRFTTGGECNASMTLANGVIYAASKDQTLYGLDAETGEEVFSFPLEGFVDFGPAVLDGVAYVGNHLGVFYAISGTGEEIIQAPITDSEATPAATQALVTEPVWQLGQETEGIGELGDMAIGPDGNISVIDWTNNAVHVVSPDGELLRTWGTPGSGEGEFDIINQAGIAIDAAGDVYFVTGGGPMHGVQKFDAEGNFLLRWGGTGEGDGQFLEATDLAIDQDGNVYVNDWRRGDIQKFDSEGNYLLTISSPGDGQFIELARISSDPEGHLYVANRQYVHEFDVNGTFLGSFDLAASAEGGVAPFAADAAVDEAGNVYVSDIANNHIVVFDPEANILTTIGSFGAEPGQFVEPDALLWDGNGHLYVEEAGNHRIQQLSVTVPESAAAPELSAEFLWEVGGNIEGLGQAGPAAVAPDGSIWMLDFSDGEMLIFSSSGDLLERWRGSDAPGGALTTGDQAAVAIGPNGNIYTIDFPNRAIQSFDADRTFAFTWGEQGTGDGQFLAPTDIAVDPDGNVYVSDWQREDVQKFSPNGDYLWTVGGTDMALNPRIGVDGEGNLYAASGAKAHKFSPDGQLMQSFGNDGSTEGRLGVAIDIAIDDAGNIYVSDVQNNQVKVYDPAGTFLGPIGSFGGGPGPFVQPDELAWHDGRLYVSDWGNRRLQVFEVSAPETAS